MCHGRTQHTYLLTSVCSYKHLSLRKFVLTIGLSTSLSWKSFLDILWLLYPEAPSVQILTSVIWDTYPYHRGCYLEMSKELSKLGKEWEGGSRKGAMRFLLKKGISKNHMLHWLLCLPLFVPFFISIHIDFPKKFFFFKNIFFHFWSLASIWYLDPKWDLYTLKQPSYFL